MLCLWAQLVCVQRGAALVDVERGELVFVTRDPRAGSWMETDRRRSAVRDALARVRKCSRLHSQSSRQSLEPRESVGGAVACGLECGARAFPLPLISRAHTVRALSSQEPGVGPRRAAERNADTAVGTQRDPCEIQVTDEMFIYLVLRGRVAQNACQNDKCKGLSFN